MLYRYGPARFVVLLPEQGVETANLAANRLRTAVERAAPAGTAISVGIVTTGAAPEPAALLAAAEATLTQAATQAGGVLHGGGAGGGVCGCSWPTMTRCRG